MKLIHSHLDYFTKMSISQRLKSSYKMLTVAAKLLPGALPPSRATPGSSGYDLHAYLNKPLNISPGQTACVQTGVHLSIPFGWEGQVRSRSGLSVKGIYVLNSPGTIDSDYRGEIKVVLHSVRSEDFQIEPNMRIAQLVFAEVPSVDWTYQELDSTQRGTGGFGSTGL